MEEEILGEIKNLAFHAFGGDRYIYNIYFTENRLLTFYLDAGHIGPVYPELDLGNFRNIGLKKRVDEKNSKFGIGNMSTKEILSSNIKNFDIYYKDIEEIIMKRAGFRFKLKNKHKLDFVGKNPTFGFWKMSDKKDAYNLLKKFIPAKITEKKLFW